MIASLKGRLVSISPKCVIEVGGVGFELLVPQKDLELLKDRGPEASLYTYLYVREDRLILYGFLRPQERELFLRLLDVSGVGPKLALGILSVHSGDRIVSAVRGGDIPFLIGIPGLGKKSAERLVMELKDKLTGLEGSGGESPGSGDVKDEVVLALIALGMTRGAAERAIEKIEWDGIKDSRVEVFVREALKHAGR